VHKKDNILDIRGFLLRGKKKPLLRILLGISLILALWGFWVILRIWTQGLAVLGLNNHIVWGVIICNFVFWIGLSHAGTFISAILLLSRSSWRISISRIAEGMTIIAILIASFMPLIHLGKSSAFYKMFPVFDNMGFAILNFHSPLMWDFYAILSYFIASLLFFMLGLIPDMATLRDNAKNRIQKKIYGYFAFGWIGNLQAWKAHKKTSFILAALITPLVISVHSIVSFDFAVSLQPGWHSTLYPLYFVFGAIISGFAFTYILIYLAALLLPAGRYIKSIHMENINKIVLFAAVMLVLIWFAEQYSHFSHKNAFDTALIRNQWSGINGVLHGFMILCILILPQLFWVKKFRVLPLYALIINILLLAGMWIERYMIVIAGTELKYLPGNTSQYQWTFESLGLVLSPFALFFLLFYLLFRNIPALPVYEIKKQDA
jgi:Ni/Fe-hydrogenase subunit HybB-like protein